MKIGIDVSQIVYGTGVSNYTKSLVENLLKIDNKNEYVLFGSSLRSKKKLKEFKDSLKDYQNVEFKIASIPPTLLEFVWNRLRVLPIEKFIGEVDIFHSSDWTQPKIKSPKTKRVTTIHDMVTYIFPASLHPKIIAAQKRRLKHVKSEVDVIIADSETTKDDVTKFLHIPQDKIKVVYLAASGDFQPQDDEKINQALEKYKIRKPYILSVATQEPRKNIQKLLDVFETILKDNPQFHLVLTGKYGWGSGFHSPENVIWTNYVSQEDLVSLYAGCRVFVYPSLYEGFGLPILEAMACGAPVVTSNNSSMAEIAKDAAILVDPRSEGQLTRAIQMVINLNMDNYQKMVRASLGRARRYSWTKTAKETLAIYEELAKGPELDTQAPDA
ncbi:MAG: glycosyltransferase family 4 protein [Candidatus Curtissbacteria bacterium]|nr:glycosyltransferase family 4 protein [Candidatus Curtissbacteria bacterium]